MKLKLTIHSLLCILFKQCIHAHNFVEIWCTVWKCNIYLFTHSWLTLAILCCLRRRYVCPVL